MAARESAAAISLPDVGHSKRSWILPAKWPTAPPAEGRNARATIDRRKRSNVFCLDAVDAFGKFKAGKPKVRGQQVGIRMGQPFEDHDGCRSPEIDNAGAARMPPAIREGSTDSIETRPVCRAVQPPEPRHQ